MESAAKILIVSALIITTTLTTGSDGQFLSGPRYSLENMPKTSFSCRDKILGGYYADPETQCQMFHVCVKVSGVGVQDFRFLCPNGTAFDQEAQICADWGDVDCEAATLYYGSDNFDLYRLGSGFESKRAPFAEEEESTFHLQRAETSDARRSKQYIVNQSTKPQQTPFASPNQIPSAQKPYHHRQPPAPSTTSTTTTSTTTRQPTTSSYSTTENYYSALQYQKHLQHKQQQLLYNQQQQLQQQQYRQLTAAAATATPADRKPQSTTTPANFGSNKQQLRNDYNNDEIFRGAHSSHFFNNRNNGKEDAEDEYVKKYTTSTAAPTTATGRQQQAANSTVRSRGRNRGRGSVRAHNLNIVQNDIKPTTARNTKLQPTTPEGFVDVPKAPSNSRRVNSFNQHPTTVLKPQSDNRINFGHTPASTNVPVSRGQRPAQNSGTNRNGNTILQQQQINSLPTRTSQAQNFQQYQTTTSTTQQPRFQQYQTTTSTPQQPRFQQSQTTTLTPQHPRLQQSQTTTLTPQQPRFQQSQTTTLAPQQPRFQQFQTTTTTLATTKDSRTPVTTPASRTISQFNGFNNQQQFGQGHQQNPTTTPQTPSINFQFLNRNQGNDATSIVSTTTTTVAPTSQFNNRVQQTSQFHNTAFENKATERSLNEITTTPQEPQRIRAQSRAFSVDPNRYNQFNYNEYQGSRAGTTTTTSTTTTTTTTPTTENVQPSTYNPFIFRTQQIPQRQSPQSQNRNPFDPRKTPAEPITPITTSTLRTSTNERYHTIARIAGDNYTPSSIKKFSTLVPKDQYNPTTFKPNALSKKALLQFVIQNPEKPQEKIVPAPVKSTLYIPTIPPVTITTTTISPTTTTVATPAVRKQPTTIFFQQQPQQRPIQTTTTQLPEETIEDDGQYHPELYEKDFYRNRVKSKPIEERKLTTDPLTSTRNNNFFPQSTPVSQSLLSGSDEDEIFRTAHSQNIAASGNDLILERARQAAAKINEFLSSSSDAHQKTLSSTRDVRQTGQPETILESSNDSAECDQHEETVRG
ncbi:mucin-2 [Toxorhynchites rutilus septentrionalis]|uniref:mucin-2 n=1 Tax=Toxorhynchites rutilus septentrionalis TaxID=329112 RepID=UPI002479BF71|nr:mucin-2 [Toxorhynchites rutilus septentrionalis]XP_055625867.1 mucin-2 [Toxorhynchites rutilus septentrionalis]XP_055625876.1 mucin-2 [Toxorhynchites rutilus septentrionalis]XP_055625884.1 mucin-2 [Toxorhynchites rutilus septentrionalis]